MIYDQISHVEQYAGVNEGVDRLLKTMANYTPENFPTGRLELEGGDPFLIFAAYETHPRAEAVMEAHRRYIDIMYMVDGAENIYVKSTEKLQQITAVYDSTVEALLAAVDDDVAEVHLTPGSFVVLFPQDAHAPACHADGIHSVKKIIGKIRIS